MGTLNKINLQKTIDKYTATNQVKVEKIKRKLIKLCGN